MMSSLWRWLNHYDIKMLTSLSWHQGKTWKYYTISLNTVDTGGLCRVLGFIAPLILIWKTFQIYLYIEQCFLYPNWTSSNKTVTFGYLIDMGIADKPYKTPGWLFLGSYLEPHSLMSRFANGDLLSTPSCFIRQCKINIHNFSPLLT